MGVVLSEELDGCYKSIAAPIPRIIAASTLEDICHQNLALRRDEGVFPSFKLHHHLYQVRDVIGCNSHLVSHIWYTLQWYDAA